MPLRVFDYMERTSAPKTASAAAQNPGAEYVLKTEFDALSARADALAAEIETLKSQKCSCKEAAAKAASRKAVKEKEDDEA